jgi:hypothetical protein
MTHALMIRRGTLINDDPQRRCYNGCYYKSHVEWTEWKHWMDFPSEEAAKTAKRLFSRADQEFKVVAKSADEGVR